MYQYISANHITKDLTTLRYKSLDDFVAEKSKMFNTFEELEKYITVPRLVVQPVEDVSPIEDVGLENTETQEVLDSLDGAVVEGDLEQAIKPEDPVFEVIDADEDLLYALITKGSVEGVGFQKQFQRMSVSGSAVAVSLGSDGIPQDVQEVERVEPEEPEIQYSQVMVNIPTNLEGGE